MRSTINGGEAGAGEMGSLPASRKSGLAPTLLRDVTSHVLDCGTRFYIVFRGRMVLREFRDRSEAHRKLGSLLLGLDVQQATTQDQEAA